MNQKMLEGDFSNNPKKYTLFPLSKRTPLDPPTARQLSAHFSEHEENGSEPKTVFILIQLPYFEQLQYGFPNKTRSIPGKQ